MSLLRTLQRHMKKTDLVKNLRLKIVGQMQHAAIPGRFAQGSAALPDRKEQRKLDQAAGLVPFAVKLHADLVNQLREMAERDGVNLNTLTDQLIRAGLGDAASAMPAKTVAKAAAQAPAKKASAQKAAPVKAVEEVKAPAKKAVAKKAPAKKAPAKKAVKPKA